MGVTILLLLVGAGVLTVGAEAAIRGVARFAAAHRLSPFLLGALLFGVDLESLGAALIAAGRGQTSLAAGEAFGTVVFLFAVGLGVALLVSRRPLPAPSPLMVLVPAAALVAGGIAMVNQTVTRGWGVTLVVLYAAYVVLLVREGRAARAAAAEIEHEAAEAAPLTSRIPPLVLAVAGLGLVYLGAQVLVEGGIRLLDRTGLAAGFVGAALVGALASLDEVFLEVIPIRRGIPELATGNLFGTIVAFSTGVLGLAALVHPLEIDTAASTAYLVATLLYAIVAVTFLLRGRAGRVIGVVLLAVYAVWLAFGWRM